jgi:serine/threonine protein kinase/tetratricopeptide (TPR) repeat protein
MPLPTLIKSGLSLLLGDFIIENSDKALSTLQEHFTFRADEITKAYQDSYGYSIAAITIGLSAPEQKLFFVQKYLHSKITRDFADPIEDDYFQPFLQPQTQKGENLRQQFIKELNKLIKYKDQLFQSNQFAEEDLAAVINYQASLAITDTLLDEMRQFAPLDETLAAFLSHKELLGKAILYFFHDIIRQDDRVAKTQAALQQEGLIISVKNIETVIQTTQDNLNQAVISQSTQLVEIAQKLQNLQAWQTRNEFLTEFSQQFPAWRDLLDHQVEQLLNGVEHVFVKLDEVHEDVIETKGLAEQILAQVSKLMASQNLSSQIKPRDEFTQHNSRSLKQIQQVALQFKQLSTLDPEYSRVSNMVGSVLSSTGNLQQAERFFRKAIENAQDNSEKALAHFNLFQVYLRRKTYEAALAELQLAIELDSERYALHDINKGYYPIERFLGAGGMGCVLLCKNKNRLIKQERVVVKCFWETLKSDINDVFNEPFNMSDIAGDFIAKPLDYGYANNVSKQRAYFVTEYIEGAIDGEAWLEKYGAMDLETILDVGLQVAKGLQLAHDNGIYHLDLKPANLLLKQAESGIQVKIIDFGLSQVATSLSELATQKSQTGLSVFGQAVLGGTLDYAPPEQQSFDRHCKPDAKNDVFAFGATMYRLCTQKRPRPFRERNLPNVPALRDLLCDCVEDERENRPDSARELVSQLEEIAGKAEAQKRQAEIARRKAEEKRQAEIAQRKAEEKRQAEIARRKAEEKRQAEIAKQKAEKERKRQAEIKAEQEQKWQAEISKQKAEQETKEYAKRPNRDKTPKPSFLNKVGVFLKIVDRYTDNGDGTVTDNRTGLIWLKNANCFGRQNWETAMQSAAKLADGQCGLTDGSKAGDWRLPTKEEWKAMVDNRYTQPALSNAAGTDQWKEGDAFSGVQSDIYWSSSTNVNATSNAWYVGLNGGNVSSGTKTFTNYVWPVRGGH